MRSRTRSNNRKFVSNPLWQPTQVRDIPIDIVGSNTFGRYPKQSIAATYNMIVSTTPDGDALVPYAGYQKVLQILTGGAQGRALFSSEKAQKLIAVVGNQVFTIGKNLGLTRIGQLESSVGNVFITANNANQIALVDGLFVYIFDITTSAFTQVSVPFRPVYISFQDSYFISCDGDTNEWYLSELNNGLVWPVAPENVGALETKPDIMMATAAFDRQLFVMGRRTTEIWHDVADRIYTGERFTLFPYQRDNTISIDYGCINASTIAVGFRLIVWLAINEKAGVTILASNGGYPQQLADDGINFFLDKLENPEDSTAFLFEEDGHIFYHITFFTDNVTLAYDFNTRKFFFITNHCLDAHIARRVSFFNNTHYFLSNQDGALYEMGTQFSTYNETISNNQKGFVIPRIRITSPFRYPDSRRYSMVSMTVTTEMGNAYLLPDNEMPEAGVVQKNQIAQLSMSKDGGRTFGNNVTKPFKPIGNRANRLRWLGLGSSNDTVFQYRFYGKFPFVIINGWLGVEE